MPRPPRTSSVALGVFGVNRREVTYSAYKTFDGIPVAR